jgi:hypothetical protein
MVVTGDPPADRGQLAELHRTQPRPFRSTSHQHGADIEFLSPYPTHNIRRFGRYKRHLDRAPESWIREALFGQAARPDDEMR